jgi:hypothetical protein
MSLMSRRRLIGGLGGSLLAGTFCDRLLVRQANAATPHTAKRLIVVFTPDGTYPDYWPPNETSDGGFELENDSMLEPLAPHKDDIILINGLDLYAAPNTVSCQHAFGMGAILTNVAQPPPYGYGGYAGNGGVGTDTNGMSIDQYVASIIGNQSRFRSLELGVQTSTSTVYADDAYTRMCYSAPNTPVVPDDNPASVYSRLFDAFLPDQRAVTTRRKSLLDMAYMDLKDLSYRVSPTERAKLDLHLQAIEDIEHSWTGLDLACTAPDSPDIDEYDENANFPEVLKAQIDLLVTAIACGMTNVGSLQMSQTISYMVQTWLGHSTDWHALSHAVSYGADATEQYIAGTRFFMENVSYLLDRLKSFPDPDIYGGTLLDTTIVLVVHELSNSVLHTYTKEQFILAGNACGQWQTGKYYDIDGHNHSELLVSICQAMGIDIDTFGEPDSGSGGLAVLS